MRSRRSIVVLVMLAVGGSRLGAQAVPEKNPFDGDPDAIRAGMGLFRERCADCHGMDARGVRGPDITQVWASGRTDEVCSRPFANGVPEHRDAGVRSAAHVRPRGLADPRVPAHARRAGARPIRRAATPRTASGSFARTAPAATA